MSPFLAEAPGGDTLLDVHPTLLKVIFKGCIPPSPIYLEGDEGRGPAFISSRRKRSVISSRLVHGGLVIGITEWRCFHSTPFC